MIPYGPLAFLGSTVRVAPVVENSFSSRGQKHGKRGVLASDTYPGNRDCFYLMPLRIDQVIFICNFTKHTENSHFWFLPSSSDFLFVFKDCIAREIFVQWVRHVPSMRHTQVQSLVLHMIP